MLDIEIIVWMMRALSQKLNLRLRNFRFQQLQLNQISIVDQSFLSKFWSENLSFVCFYNVWKNNLKMLFFDLRHIHDLIKHSSYLSFSKAHRVRNYTLQNHKNSSLLFQNIDSTLKGLNDKLSQFLRLLSFQLIQIFQNPILFPSIVFS